MPRNRFVLMSGSKKLSLLMKQSTSSRSALIVQSFSCMLCYPRLEVQELPRIHFRSDLVSVGDCERFARGRPRRMTTLPMQNCATENVHSREADPGCPTCENLRRHRHASNPLLEQNVAPLVSVSLSAVLTETSALVETLGS